MTLALAAGTLGLSSDAGRRAHRPWSSAHLQSHGGIVGEALYRLAHRLVQDVGVDILVVFLLLVGVDPADGRLARERDPRDRQRPGGHDAHGRAALGAREPRPRGADERLERRTSRTPIAAARPSPRRRS